MDLVYPDIEDVYRAFEIATDHLGGTARFYTRPGVIEGTLARPKHYAQLYNSDIATQAAVLAHGIAETQPFIDGNKRTALQLMAQFLMDNGYLIDATDDELFTWILALAEGSGFADLAEKLQPRLVSL